MNKKSLRSVFRRHPILFAYLFGSQAKGRVAASSDVDIAAFLSPDLSPAERGDLRMSLASDLMGALKRDDLDLVILNGAPPFLAFQAIQPGVLLYSRDDLARTRFEARTLSLYFDRLHSFQKSADTMIRQVAHRGLR